MGFKDLFEIYVFWALWDFLGCY